MAPVDPTAGATSPLTWQFDPDGAAALYDAYKRDDGALRVALDPPMGHGGRHGSSSSQPGSSTRCTWFEPSGLSGGRKRR